MLSRINTAILWLGALLAAAMPGVVALDNGGVLPWSFWALSAAVLVPSIIAFCAYREELVPQGLLPHFLTLALILLGAFSLFQAIPLPESLVRYISPGSYRVWTEWQQTAEIISPQSATVTGASISVAPELSISSASKFFLMAAFAWCGTMLFSSRNAILQLLILTSLLGTVHSVIGLYQLFLFPDFTFWGVPAHHPFGVFVNRNNAAMLLNLSLACSLGLLGWRLALVTGFEFGQRGFGLSALLDLASDKISLLAILSGGLNLIGILACGSRGGLAGAILGFVLSIGFFSYRPLYSKALTAAVITTIVALVLLVRVDVSPRTLERFGASAEGLSQSVFANQRIEHWQDTMTAMPSHFLTGSGFGTYRYAHLPYQERGVGWWFENADNLWLEWSLEGGLLAVLILLATTAIIVYCLLRLRDTPDPMDHGIVTTGWFALAAILVSQTFDFGLLLAGSASLACLIFGAVLGRAAIDGLSLGSKSSEPGARLKFKSGSYDSLGLITGSSVILLLAFATYRLQQEAFVDSALRSATAEFSSSSPSIEDMQAQIDILDNLPLKTSKVYYARGRASARILTKEVETEIKKLNLVDENLPLDDFRVFTLIRIFEDTAQNATAPSSELASLQSKLNTLNQTFQPRMVKLHDDLATAINRSPLYSDPRFLFLKTSLKETGDGRIEKELLGLHGYANEALEKLANYASDNRNWELATVCWQRLLANAPHRVNELLLKADRVGHPDPVSIVPDSVEAVERAATFRLDQGYLDQQFLTNAFELLSDPLPQNRSQRSQRYLLLAKIKDALGDFDDGAKYYKDAIEASPMLLETHLAYVISMMNQGKLADARRYAKVMKETFGETNYRLNQLLQQIESKLDSSTVISDSKR